MNVTVTPAGIVEIEAGYEPYILDKWKEWGRSAPSEIYPEMFKPQDMMLTASIVLSFVMFVVLALVRFESAGLAWSAGMLVVLLAGQDLIWVQKKNLKGKLEEVYQDPVLAD